MVGKYIIININLIKPIAATPILSGKDSKWIMMQVEKMPTESAIEKNKKLVEILRKVKNNEQNCRMRDYGGAC